MARFTYNPRTGELSGLQGISIGTPAQSIETYVTDYISNHTSDVHDSDLVMATVLKNLDIAALSSLGGGGGGVSYDDTVVVSRLDSDSAVIQYLNTQLEGILLDLDSDRAVNLARHNQLTQDLDSDVLNLNNNIIAINNLLDSESQKVQSLKTRVFTVVKNNDSDHNKKLNRIENQLDSDRSQFEAVKRFILGQNVSGPSNNLHEYYQSSGTFGYNPFHDSDLVIESAIKGFNVAAASYDSDRTVQTINKNLDIAALSNINTNAIDSDEVYNMGFEHGWFYDSDRVMASVGKNFNNIINVINNNLGKVDSDFVFTMLDSEEVLNMFNEHGLAYQTALDSESAEIRILRADVDALVAGTYNDAPVLARLDDLEASVDSESARIQLLFSNADSDTINIAQLRRDADSDSVVIQSLREQANLDAAYITLIRNDLDSDDHAIQALRTDMDSESARINSRLTTLQDNIDTAEATNTIQNSRLNTLEARADSDELIVQSLQTQIDNFSSGFDSEQVVSIINENVTPYDDSALVARLDSDETIIQSLQTQLDGFDVADIRARLDSDSIAIQSIRSSVDSDYALFNAKIALFNGLTDSDLTTVSILRNDLDSESFEIKALRSDVDSDNSVIQSLQTQISSLDSDYVLERTPLRLNSASFATTASNQILDTYDANEHKTVKYIISAKKGSDWQSSECLINHDGTTAYITEYALIDSGAGDLYIPDTDISGNAVRLLITPQVTNIEVSIIRTQIT